MTMFAPPSYAVRHADELLAACGITVSYETVRQWGLKFGQGFAKQIRRRLPGVGDKWHLDEVAVKIAGVQHWLWRAVDQNGVVLDVLLQSRRNKKPPSACCASCSSANAKHCV